MQNRQGMAQKRGYENSFPNLNFINGKKKKRKRQRKQNIQKNSLSKSHGE